MGEAKEEVHQEAINGRGMGGGYSGSTEHRCP
jgi:hypothetical protein